MVARKTDMWMPLYVGDYLGDTMALQMDEHGFYFLLILYYWRKGPPPDNPNVLRAITKCPVRDYMRVSEAVKPFFTVTGGVWVHKRIEEELLKAQTNKDVAVAKGRAGAEARWGNAPANAPAIAPAIAQAMPTQCLADSSSPSPSPKEEKRGAAQAPDPPFEVGIWNAQKQLPKCLSWTGDRLRKLKVRRADPFFAAHFAEAVLKIAASDFCKGANDRGWKATFDWMLRPDTVVKVIEGKYDNRTAVGQPNPRNVGIARCATQISWGEASKRIQERQRQKREEESKQRTGVAGAVAEVGDAPPAA